MVGVTMKHLKCYPSIFPDRRVIEIPRNLLNGASSIILARQDPGGFQPFAVRLPHQVYVEDIPQMLDGCRTLWALPVGVRASWIQLVGPEPGYLHPEVKVKV